MCQKEDRRPIIYELGVEPIDRWTYLIYPTKVETDGDPGESWTVYTLKNQRQVSSEWKRSKMVDFVIDPPQFSSGADPQPSMLIGASGHTFIAASTYNRHLGGGDKSFMKIFELVLGPFILDQLKIAFPFMLYSDPEGQYGLDAGRFENDMKLMVLNVRRQ